MANLKKVEIKILKSIDLLKGKNCMAPNLAFLSEKNNLELSEIIPIISRLLKLKLIIVYSIKNNIFIDFNFDSEVIDYLD
jgi:hypothetical protein